MKTGKIWFCIAPLKLFFFNDRFDPFCTDRCVRTHAHFHTNDFGIVKKRDDAVGDDERSIYSREILHQLSSVDAAGGFHE